MMTFLCSNSDLQSLHHLRTPNESGGFASDASCRCGRVIVAPTSAANCRLRFTITIHCRRLPVVPGAPTIGRPGSVRPPRQPLPTCAYSRGGLVLPDPRPFEGLVLIRL